MEMELEKRTLRRITWRIVPFIMLLYFIAYLDRVNIGFAALTAIHYVHRLAAYGVLLVLALLVWRLLRAQLLRDQARWLAGLGALQLLTGLSNVILDWPLVAAVLHTGGAAALVVVLTWALVASRSATAEARAAHVQARQPAAKRVSA